MKNFKTFLNQFVRKQIYFFIILIHFQPCLPEGNYKHKNSSYPHVSERTFAYFADFRVEPHDKSFRPNQVKNGDIIYIYSHTPFLKTFFEKTHPHIKAQYILITHGSISSAPGPFLKYLNDPKIIAWFAKNIDLSNHPKLFPIPLGIGNKKYPHGNIGIIQNVMQKAKPLLERRTNKLIYINFKISMNPKERESALQTLINKSFCFRTRLKPTKSLSFHAQRKNFNEYLKEMAEFRFVLSPPGAGMDCHRTWEALLVGCIPIIKGLPINRLYEDLPVVIVNDWSEITAAFLQKKYEEIIHKTYNREKLFADYWFNQIRLVQQQYRESIK